MSQVLKLVDYTAGDGLTPLERLEYAIRQEFKVEVFEPPHGHLSLYPACHFNDCERVRSNGRFCGMHEARFARHFGKASSTGTFSEFESFVRDPGIHGVGRNREFAKPAFSLIGLHPRLANELRLVLQETCDNPETGVYIRANFWKPLVGHMRAIKLESVFDLTGMTARDVVMVNPQHIDLNLDGFPNLGKVLQATLRRAIRLSAYLYEPIPVYQRDSWRPLDFSIRDTALGVNQSSLNFYPIKAQWLKAWFKRYMLHNIKILTKTWGTLLTDVHDIRYFDQFLEQYDRKIKAPEQIDRKLLDDFVMFLHSGNATISYGGEERPLQARGIKSVLVTVRDLLMVHRLEEWEPKLKPTAELRIGYIKEPPPQPKPIDPFILNQIMSRDFLNKIERSLANAIVIARYQGLRPSSLVELKYDCLSYSSENSDLPVLTYKNVKLKRYAEQPILHKAVVDAIHDQQRFVREKFSEESPWLFPRLQRNPDGKVRRDSSGMQSTLMYYSQTLGMIRDRQGNPTYVAWGQFRDTRATELLNQGVHPIIVAEWLNHKNLSSLDHYARVHTDTMRREISKKENVMIDLTGDEISVPREEDGLITNVETMRQMVKRGVNTVMGGVCTLPVQETCSSMHACFSCKKFATSPSHLPELLKHLQHSSLLVVAHEANGHQRKAAKEKAESQNVKKVINVIMQWLESHPEEKAGMEDFLLTNSVDLNQSTIIRND